MKLLPALATTLALALPFQVALPFPAAVRAQAVNGLFATRAQGLNAGPQQVHVWPGYDTAISFLETGAIVKHIQLSNLTRTVITTDGTFEFNPSGGGSGEARILYLKPIEQLPSTGSFSNLLTAETASLFVVAELPDGTMQQYVFELVHETGKPRYSVLAVYPDSRGTPAIELGGLQRASLGHLESGLVLARQEETSEEERGMHDRVAEWISLVRNGALFPQASAQAGVGMEVIQHYARKGLAAVADRQLTSLNP